MICPYCKGRKQTFRHIHYADQPHEWKWIDCRICDGTGEITEEHAVRIEAGKRLRDDRIARDMSLREEAKRLGISAHELSDREHGRLP